MRAGRLGKLSKSTAARICSELRERFEAFGRRDLYDIGLAALFLDATAPPRFTDGTLLTAMETAGRTLDEKELSKAMRECGLGTPATRAQIMDRAIDYLLR